MLDFSLPRRLPCVMPMGSITWTAALAMFALYQLFAPAPNAGERRMRVGYVEIDASVRGGQAAAKWRVSGDL